MRRVLIALHQAKGAAERRLRIRRLTADRNRASDELVEAKKQEAVAVAELKRLAKRYERAVENVADCERRAKVVRYAADIERPKEAQAQLREHEVLATEAESQWERRC